MIGRLSCSICKLGAAKTRLLRFASTAALQEAAAAAAVTTSTSSGSTSSNLLDVSTLAERMRVEVRNYTRQHSNVRLVGILASEGEFRQDAEMYSERIAETTYEDGIEYELVRCRGGERAHVERTIQEMNARMDVTGILVFYPIFDRMRKSSLPKTYLNKKNGTYYRTHDDSLRDLVHPTKDVEGLCQNYNARRLFRARAKNRMPNEVYVPCTALAVTKILETYHGQHHYFEKSNSNNHHHHSQIIPDWSNTTITVINRSEIFGRPLAALLALNGANVYSVDEDSILQFQKGGRMRRCTDLNLEACLERSSVVVTGVPSPDFSLPADRIPDGATVVNVSEFPNVDALDFVHRPRVTVIPQVGKVTVAALEHNLIRLHQRAASQVVTSI